MLLWNRSPASNSSDAPLTTSSRGKITWTASMSRSAGGCTFCAYSEGPGLSHTTLSESSPLQFTPFWNMHVRLGTPASLGKSGKLESIYRQAMCIVAPDLSYRQVLANFGLPTLKERRDLTRDFYIKIVRNPDHKLCYLLPHERTIMYGLRTAKPYQNPKFNTARTRKTLIPYGIAHWI